MRSQGALRIALLDSSFDSSADVRPAHGLALALARAGHHPTVITAHFGPTRASVDDGVSIVRVARLPEGLLRGRGFTGPLTHMPLTLRALRRGLFDVAHAFSPPDAAVALRWAHSTGRPAIFTCAEVLDREVLADRRLRLRLLADAVERTDATIVTSEAARAALARWMAVDGLLLEPSDAVSHESSYRRLLESSHM